MGPGGISTAITEIVGFNYELKPTEIEMPTDPKEGAQEFEDSFLNTNTDQGQTELVGYDMKEYRLLDILPK